MQRIKEKFEELKRKGEKALIPYLTCGYPSLEETRKIIPLLEKAGADLIELGIPFSDPVADGVTIQESSAVALKKGINLRKIVGLVKELREKVKIPLLIMSYYNPIYQFGLSRFCSTFKNAGLDGVMIPDLPIEEGNDLVSLARDNDLATVFLIAPTTPKERIREVCKKSTGFIYYVSVSGVTGERERLPKEIEKKVLQIKQFTERPVCVGFGVSRPEQVREITSFADGVIVGSAIIRVMEERKDYLSSLLDFLSLLKSATKTIHIV